MSYRGSTGASFEAQLELMGQHAEGVLTSSGIGEIPYNSSWLKGEGLDPVFDPDILVSPEMATMYYPKDSAPGGGSVATVGLHHTSTRHDISSIRTWLLGLEVPDDAAERERLGGDTVRKQLKESGWVDIPEVLCAQAALMGVPAVMVVKHHVIHGRSIEPDARIASVHYLFGLPPRTALRRLQHAIRQMIADETI